MCRELIVSLPLFLLLFYCLSKVLEGPETRLCAPLRRFAVHILRPRPGVVRELWSCICAANAVTDRRR